jgi:hypothetical protein
MASNEANIAKTATITVRLTPEISEKLDELARNTKRSKSYLASEAIASFVDVNACRRPASSGRSTMRSPARRASPTAKSWIG